MIIRLIHLVIAKIEVWIKEIEAWLQAKIDAIHADTKEAIAPIEQKIEASKDAIEEK